MQGCSFLVQQSHLIISKKNKNQKQKMDVLDEGTRLEGYMGPDSDHDNEKIAKEP